MLQIMYFIYLHHLDAICTPVHPFQKERNTKHFESVCENLVERKITG